MLLLASEEGIRRQTRERGGTYGSEVLRIKSKGQRRGRSRCGGKVFMQLIGPRPNFKQVRNLNVCRGTCSDVIRCIKWRDDGVAKFHNFLPWTSTLPSLFFFFTCWSCFFFSSNERNFILARDIAVQSNQISLQRYDRPKIFDRNWNFVFQCDRNVQLWAGLLWKFYRFTTMPFFLEISMIFHKARWGA